MSKTSGMSVKEAIRNRRSTRAYQDKTVPVELMHELLDDALWSPSWGNTQCWEIYVAQGDDLNKIKEGFLQRYQDGVTPSADIPMAVDIKTDWPERMKNRYMAVGKAIFDHLDIKRGDSEGREAYYHSMHRFFDAPSLIVLAVDKDVSVEYGLFDLGILTQTISLAAHEKGLGTCIMALTAFYPEVIRDVLNIKDNHKIAVGITLGYPDNENRINSFKRDRVEKEEVLHHG